MTIKKDWTAGDKLYASELNGNFEELQDLKDTKIKTIVAGENITALKPIYIHTDGKAYLCLANNTAKLNFAGFAITTGLTDANINLQVEGIVSGFTSLTIGSYYYLQDDGTIGLVAGTYVVLVGRAVSSTEIMITNVPVELFCVASDNTKISLDTTRTTSGERTTKIMKEIQLPFSGKVRVTFGYTSNEGDNYVDFLDSHNVGLVTNLGDGSSGSYSGDWFVHKGETLKLQGRTSNTIGNNVTVSNFRIKYDLEVENLPKTITDS